MSDRLVVLATFSNEVEAALAQNLLANSGIPAQLDGEGFANLFGQVANPLGVRLLVFEKDIPRAEQVLDEHDGGTPAPAQAGETGISDQRTCPNCGKLFPSELGDCPECGPGVNFDIEDPDEEAITTPAEMERSEAEALAQRAFRAAIIGLLVLPPLFNLYSLWLLSRLFSFNGELSRTGLRKYYIAIAINVVLLPLSFFMINSAFYLSYLLLSEISRVLMRQAL